MSIVKKIIGVILLSIGSLLAVCALAPICSLPGANPDKTGELIARLVMLVIGIGLLYPGLRLIAPRSKKKE